MSDITDLEHKLGIAGHEDDCPVCQTRKAIEEGRCHQMSGGYIIRMFGCPHSEEDDDE